MKTLYVLLFTFLSTATFAQSFMNEVEPRHIQNRSGAVVPITATIGYQGYEETQAYFGEGEYEIFLDNVDGILDKPIIILDGFDPGDGRDIAGLYNSLTFDGDNLADIVRDEGFDIIILNAPQYTTGGKAIDGGADYIQRNAFVLIEMINFLNAQKEGDAELVVLGPSMGGLIARYALAYMEQNSLEAETRLFISLDSPHRGANIPISLQYVINYLAQSLGDPDALAIVDNVLNSPAAKEMLLDHVLAHLLAGSDYEQDPTKLLPAGAPNFRDAFQAELDALGFASNVRNVAMVNGSGQSVTTGSPGVEVINTTLDIAAFTTADVRLNFVPAINQSINVSFFETFLLGLSVDLFEADAATAAVSDGIDSSPGGTGNISSALSGAGNNQVILDFIAALQQDEYSFIPVISALAIDNEDDWYAAPDIGGIHTSGFVNTFIPAVNEPHTAVTAASAAFALAEIRQQPLGISDLDTTNKYLLAKNPVGPQIQLKLDAAFSFGTVAIAVNAITGQQVLKTSVVNPSGEIALDHALASGVYVLSVSDAEGVYTFKFMVQ